MNECSEPHALAFFGGGSGGHLYPGLALVEWAREKDPGFRAVFFRSGRRVEESVLSGGALETQALPLTPPVNARASLRYFREVRAALPRLRRLLRDGFDGVVGLGGYASLPGIIAARRERLPVLLLEQNAVPGRVNRLLSRWADAVSCPDESVARLMHGRGRATGNPVRRAVIAARQSRRERSRDPFSRRVLVVGGSQGASGLNRAVCAALGDLAPLCERIEWLHVTGDADLEMVRTAYREGGWRARVESFVADLPRWMEECDLALSRAGGTTLAELTAAGVPSILVPYPHHRDRHQFRNAEVLAQAGAAVIVPEERVTAGVLRRLFDEVLLDEQRLREMERASAELGKPDAAERVLRLLGELGTRCR